MNSPEVEHMAKTRHPKIFIGKIDSFSMDDVEKGLDVLEHTNRERYPGQRLMVVRIDDYAVLVPFVEDEDRVFLKTAIPSRKATRQYLGRERK